MVYIFANMNRFSSESTVTLKKIIAHTKQLHQKILAVIPLFSFWFSYSILRSEVWTPHPWFFFWIRPWFHLCISGIEPSSLILVQTKYIVYWSVEMWYLNTTCNNLPKQIEAEIHIKWTEDVHTFHDSRFESWTMNSSWFTTRKKNHITNANFFPDLVYGPLPKGQPRSCVNRIAYTATFTIIGLRHLNFAIPFAKAI